MKLTKTYCCFIFFILFVCYAVEAQKDKVKTDKTFFNGRDLSGWSASSMKYWSVMNRAIIGQANEQLLKNEFLWSDIEVKDFYLSVDVLQNPGDRNAGIQFRSRKLDAFGQAQGYQADVGKDWWGKLYHEHGRGLLDSTTQGEKAVKWEQWNHYEILAVGNKIWTAINGTISVAIEDPEGEKSGYIALQIHSGPPQTVQYRIRKLVHNPKIKLAGFNKTELEKMLRKPIKVAQNNLRINFKDNDTVAFCGGTNIANMRKDGFLETMITAMQPDKKIYFRNLGIDGDVVYEQFREIGLPDWSTNLSEVKANIIFLSFGQMEALQEEKSIAEFIEAYKKLLNPIKSKGKIIVIISPVPCEADHFPITIVPHPQNPLNNAPLDKYNQEIAKFAESESYIYVDLIKHRNEFEALKSYTSNGIHLNESGQQLMASIIMEELHLHKEYKDQFQQLRKEIIRKNELWFNYWRPSNSAFLYGDRHWATFSYDWKNASERIFPNEIKAYEPMIAEAEKEIQNEVKKISSLK